MARRYPWRRPGPCTLDGDSRRGPSTSQRLQASGKIGEHSRRIRLSMPPLPPRSMLAVALMSCTSTAVSPARANVEFGGQGGSAIVSLYRLISGFGPLRPGRALPWSPRLERARPALPKVPRAGAGWGHLIPRGNPARPSAPGALGSPSAPTSFWFAAATRARCPQCAALPDMPTAPGSRDAPRLALLPSPAGAWTRARAAAARVVPRGIFHVSLVSLVPSLPIFNVSLISLVKKKNLLE